MFPTTVCGCHGKCSSETLLLLWPPRFGRIGGATRTTWWRPMFRFDSLLASRMVCSIYCNKCNLTVRHSDCKRRHCAVVMRMLCSAICRQQRFVVGSGLGYFPTPPPPPPTFTHSRCPLWLYGQVCVAVTICILVEHLPSIHPSITSLVCVNHGAVILGADSYVTGDNRP